MNRHDVRKRFEDIAWESRFWRKWTSVAYLHRNYGFSYRELLGMYRESVAEWEPTPDPHGFGIHEVDGMYERCANRRYDEAQQYACVEGCCTVLWHNGKNIGGAGRAGCPCDNMTDPRDLARGVLNV